MVARSTGFVAILSLNVASEGVAASAHQKGAAGTRKGRNGVYERRNASGGTLTVLTDAEGSIIVIDIRAGAHFGKSNGGADWSLSEVILGNRSVLTRAEDVAFLYLILHQRRAKVMCESNRRHPDGAHDGDGANVLRKRDGHDSRNVQS